VAVIGTLFFLVRDNFLIKVELFHNDDLFAAASTRIKDDDCLAIDEISMLSLKTFELIAFVFRYVRKTAKIFGG
jgi:uncharacterized protein YkuJ